MDFLDPAKIRSHNIRLLIGYALMALIIAVSSLVLLLRSYGYNLDRKTGAITQNGLVYVSARPESADIYVNGEQNRARTDARLEILAGSYTLELKRNGYRPWKRTFNLEGGSVERFAYPILFPEKLVTEDVNLYGAAPTFATNSPDRRWIILQRPGSLIEFDVYDINAPDQAPTQLNLPTDLLNPTGTGHKLTMVEWSTDNRHVLLKHEFEGGNEFVIIDREQAGSSVNVNRRFGLAPSLVSLRDKKFDQLFLYDEKSLDLFRAEIGSGNTERFLRGILSYKSHGNDVIVYIQNDPASPGKVQLKWRDNSGEYVIRSFKPGTQYLVDLARFDNQWYVVATARSENLAYIYKNPQDYIKNSQAVLDVPVQVMRINEPQFVSFSANARFIAVQNGKSFAVYDAETDRRYFYDLELSLPPDQKVEWMDGHRLILVNDGKTVIFDYDGINMQTLSDSLPGVNPFFDREYTLLYNVAPSVTVQGRFALVRTDLKVQQP